MSEQELAMHKKHFHKVISDGQPKTSAGACPDCGSTLFYQEGCASCPFCGYNKCEKGRVNEE